jgi:hypothetical protein
MLFRLRLACSRSRLYNCSAVGRCPRSVRLLHRQQPNESAEKVFRPRSKAFHATVLCNRGTTTATASFGSKLWNRIGCVRYRTD